MAATAALLVAAGTSACAEPDNTFVGLDVTVSMELDTRLTGLIRETLMEAAITGGLVKIVAFTSSNTETVVIYEGTIPLEAKNGPARELEAPEKIDAMMPDITAKIQAAASQIDGGSTDVLGQLTLVNDYIVDLESKGEGKVDVLLVTDGVDSSLDLESLDASQVDVPTSSANLDSFYITGIGQGNSDLPSSTTDNLIAYYTEVCERYAGAAEQCMVTSDYVLVGGERND